MDVLVLQAYQSIKQLFLLLVSKQRIVTIVVLF